MRSLGRIISIGLVLVASQVADAASPPTHEEIIRLVEANLAATEKLDTEAILETVHSESPGLTTIGQLVAQLSAYELRVEAKKVEFVGMSGEFALIRVLQHTSRIAGPDFMDNALDGIWALREEDGRWLFWSQMMLRVEPLGRTPAP